MIQFKQGLYLFGLQPEMLWALDVCESVWQEIGKNLTVTSTRWGDKHAWKSRHYSGLAVDLRTKDLHEVEIRQVAEMAAERLGDEYDVVVESNHIHVEYDPKMQRPKPSGIMV